MQIKIFHLSDLSPSVLEQWKNWISKDKNLQVPFCNPEFCRAAQHATGNVEVAVATDDRTPIAILPFQRQQSKTAGPVGGYLSNYHGWVSRPGKKVNLSSLLEKTDIRSFRFHMLPVEDVPETRFWAIRRLVVHADLSNGFNAYVEEKKKQGSNVVAKLAQKERKISREVGPLRVEVGYTEEGFSKLLKWKEEACRKRNIQNILNTHAGRETVRFLAEKNTGAQDFQPHFIRLLAGDKLVAVHFGVICYDRMQAWFPAFDTNYGHYSPGLLILLQLVRNCETWGVKRIDFGSGEFFFKDRFKTGESTMLEGIVDKNLTEAFRYWCWLKARDYAKSTEFSPILQRAWNYWRS